MSFGGASSMAMTDKIALAPEILFVAAAGNGGADGIGDDNDVVSEFPCEVNLPNVICVAATTPLDTLASFSNFGKTSVDLAAPGAAKPGFPGTNILSTIPDFKAPEIDEHFEGEVSFATDWTADPLGSTWGRVDPSGPPVDFDITDSPTGNYGANANNGIKTTTPVDLTGDADCRVTLNVSHVLASGDSLLLEGSSDLGATWPNLGVWTGVGSEAATRDLQGVDGMVPFDFDGAAMFQLRFRLVSDPSTNTVADGAHIDDVRLECSDPMAAAYGFKSGTSMASPHVAGAAALLLAEYPTYDVGDLRSALLNNVDQLNSLACVLPTGGRLNVDKAIQPGAETAPALASICPPQQQQQQQQQQPVVEEEEHRCGGKRATIVGTNGKDKIKGTKRADVIVGLSGNDTIRGRGGKDRLCGNGGKDRLFGGGGKDRLFGGSGRDFEQQ
jgi:subtilisin family serine protease